jgi:hypothetical protein
MPSGVEANIFLALYKRLQTLTFTPALAIAGPNVAFPPVGQTKPEDYLEMTFLQNATNTRSVSGSGSQQHMGILQVSVHCGSKTGIIDAMQWADMIIDHFPFGLVLFEGGKKVKISRKPYQIVQPPESGSLMVPVTIPYESFNA